MKVTDLIQWLKEKALSAEVLCKNINGTQRCSGFYGLESFLNGDNAGTERTVLIILGKDKQRSIKATNLIQLLEGKNPAADLFITEKESEFYYEIQSFEPSITDENTVYITFGRRNKKIKADLMHFSKTIDDNNMEKLFDILGNKFIGMHVLKTNGVIDLYCIDVVFSECTYTGKTIIEALKKAVADIPVQKDV